MKIDTELVRPFLGLQVKQVGGSERIANFWRSERFLALWNRADKVVAGPDIR